MINLILSINEVKYLDMKNTKEKQKKNKEKNNTPVFYYILSFFFS